MQRGLIHFGQFFDNRKSFNFIVRFTRFSQWIWLLSVFGRNLCLSGVFGFFSLLLIMLFKHVQARVCTRPNLFSQISSLFGMCGIVDKSVEAVFPIFNRLFMAKGQLYRPTLCVRWRENAKTTVRVRIPIPHSFFKRVPFRITAVHGPLMPRAVVQFHQGQPVSFGEVVQWLGQRIYNPSRV